MRHKPAERLVFNATAAIFNRSLLAREGDSLRAKKVIPQVEVRRAECHKGGIIFQLRASFKASRMAIRIARGFSLHYELAFGDGVIEMSDGLGKREEAVITSCIGEQE